METPKRSGRRTAANPYSKRIPIYDTEEGLALLNELAQRRGVSAAALMRMLVREEAKRIGIRDGETE